MAMTLEELLRELEGRGLKVERGKRGGPVLTGNLDAVDERLTREVRHWRAVLVDRFLSEPRRRIVLLKPIALLGSEREALEVLKVMGGCGHLEELRRLAELHPGRELAAEWWKESRGLWIRFATARSRSPSTTRESSPGSESCERPRAVLTFAPAAPPTTTAAPA